MNKESIRKIQKKTLLCLCVAIIATVLVSNPTITFAAESTPVIFVDPQTQVAGYRGELMTVNVNIADLASDSNLVGVQFGLRYDTTLLEVESVTYGDFLRAYGPTYNVSYVEDDHVIVLIMLMPPWSEPFPEGSGTLATITFKATYQPTGSDIASGDLKLYNTILINENAEQIPYSLTHGEFRIVPVTFKPIDIQVETGAIRFRGEIADFYISITDYGLPINPETINAALYFDGTIYADLSAMLERISNGLYRIVYEIPMDAETGAYVLLVKAEYMQVPGTNIKSFQVSSTLTGWNAQITEINNDIATIKTSLGVINTRAENLDLKVTKIDGDVAEISTSLGTIEGKIVSIEGDTATIRTDIGEVKVDLGGLKTEVSDTAGNVGTSIPLLYITLVLALIAAVVIIISVISTRKPFQ